MDDSYAVVDLNEVIEQLKEQLRVRTESLMSAREFAEEACARYNSLLDSHRHVTCAYCGHQYEDDTPESQNQRLTDHIAVCDKHPMREVLAATAKVLRIPFTAGTNSLDWFSKIRETVDKFLEEASVDELDDVLKTCSTHRSDDTRDPMSSKAYIELGKALPIGDLASSIASSRERGYILTGETRETTDMLRFYLKKNNTDKRGQE